MSSIFFVRLYFLLNLLILKKKFQKKRFINEDPRFKNIRFIFGSDFQSSFQDKSTFLSFMTVHFPSGATFFIYVVT